MPFSPRCQCFSSDNGGWCSVIIITWAWLDGLPPELGMLENLPSPYTCEAVRPISL